MCYEQIRAPMEKRRGERATGSASSWKGRRGWASDRPAAQRSEARVQLWGAQTDEWHGARPCWREAVGDALVASHADRTEAVGVATWASARPTGALGSPLRVIWQSPTGSAADPETLFGQHPRNTGDLPSIGLSADQDDGLFAVAGRMVSSHRNIDAFATGLCRADVQIAELRRWPADLLRQLDAILDPGHPPTPTPTPIIGNRQNPAHPSPSPLASPHFSPDRLMP